MGEKPVAIKGGGKAEVVKSLFLIPERFYYFHFPNLWKWLVGQNFPGFLFSVPYCS